MLQVNNYTPFVAELHPYEDLHGRDYAVVIIKGTFNPCDNRLELTLAEEQIPVQHADEYAGEPGKSSIKYGTDLALVKKAADIILNGHGYSPDGRPVEMFDVSLSVGDHSNVIRVLGDRQWQRDGLGWQISQPKKIERMPLIYENAYGGIEPYSSNQKQIEKPDFEQLNPVGKGFFPKKGKPVDQLLLPNLENPFELIQDLTSRPKPIGFGVLARDWQPRLALAGTYDEVWQEQRMPLLPLDFDPLFFNGAHPNLRISPSIQGNELVTVKNATESGNLSFQLPNQQLMVTASIRNKKTDFVAQLDTLVIEPDENRLMLTWRAVIACKRKFLYLDSITVKRCH